MAIADVRRVGPGDDPFGGPGLAGNDEIIAAQIQLLQRKRHQGKVFLVMPHASRKLLDKCRMDRVGRNGFGERLGAYDMRVDIRLWKNPAQGFDDFFSAAHTRKPVMDNGYRAWLKHVPSNTEKRRESVKAKIKDIYDKSKQNYGAPKITQVLRKTGETISERTVGQYMKQMGIKAQWVKPWTITTRDSDFSSKLQNILDEQFNPERPNAVWCSDITYI